MGMTSTRKMKTSEQRAGVTDLIISSQRGEDDSTVAVGHVAVGQESGRRMIEEEDDGDDNDDKG
jgi:hypothetical protein